MIKYAIGMILIDKASKSFFIIEDMQLSKNTRTPRYWVRALHNEHSALCKNSKRTLKSLYLIAPKSAQVLYAKRT